MTCLRVSVRDWNEGDSVSLRPFSVACYAATYDGKNCSHCNGLHKPCETVCPFGCHCCVSVGIRADNS